MLLLHDDEDDFSDALGKSRYLWYVQIIFYSYVNRAYH